MQPRTSILLGALLIASSCALAQTSLNDVSSGDDSGDGDAPAPTTATTVPVVDCSRRYPLFFLEITPCQPVRNHHIRQPVTVDECDVFVNVALSQIGADINNPDFISNCFRYFTLEIHSQGDYIRAVHDTLTNSYYRQANVGGIVGPPESEASILSPLVTRLYKKPMISYGVSGDHLTGEEHKYLYTTIPTDDFLNRARIKLMCRNNWRRIAVMSSSDATQSQAANDFLNVANKNSSDICQFTTNVTVLHLGAYTTSPNRILDRLKKEDLRIIFAFVEQERARDLICQASSFNLTLSSRYVWILPGYYNHEWWKSNVNTMCSDANVSAAAHSVVFVDVNTLSIFQAGDRLEDLLDQYIADIRGTFMLAFLNQSVPAMVHRFMYHSRALRASDAFISLVNAWESAYRDLLKNYSKDYIVNTILSERFIPDSDRPESFVISKVQEKIRECVFVGAAGIYHFSERKKNLGEAMISRFSEDGECLHGILANTGLNIVTQENQYKCLNITDFDANNFTFIEGAEIKLNLSRDDNSSDFVNRSQLIMQSCNSSDFPIDGNCYAEKCFCYRNVDGVFIAIVGGVTIVVIAAALLLLIINFILRNNKHVKASSPRLNILIVIGCIVMCPCAVLVGIEHAGPAIGPREILMQLLPPVCELRKWLFHFGFTLVIATMLTRNWRLYRIFYNKRMSVDMRFSSDRALVLITALLLVPLLMILVTSTSVDHYRYNETSTLDPCPSLGYDTAIRTFRNQTSCIASYKEVWEGIMLGYNIFMCCLLLFFAYQNSRIKAHFQQEGEFAAKAVVLVFLFVFLGTVVLFLLGHQRENINEYFWVNCFFVLGIPTAILLLLFVPKFVVVYLDRKEVKEKIKEESINRRFIENFNTKKKEIQKLRGELRTRQNNIASLKSRQPKDQFSFRSNSTGPLISPDDLPAIDEIVSSDIFESVFSSSTRFSFVSTSP